MVRPQVRGRLESHPWARHKGHLPIMPLRPDSFFSSTARIFQVGRSLSPAKAIGQSRMGRYEARPQPTLPQLRHLGPTTEISSPRMDVRTNDNLNKNILIRASHSDGDVIFYTFWTGVRRAGGEIAYLGEYRLKNRVGPLVRLGSFVFLRGTNRCQYTSIYGCQRFPRRSPNPPIATIPHSRIERGG